MIQTISKRNIKLAVVPFVIIGVVSVWALNQRPKRSNRINERWETTNGTVDIRVTAYGEDNAGLDAGAYYVFESKRAGSKDWHEITTFRHDDPVQIPREQVRFVSDQISYVFMGWMYSVTTDRGSTWSVWTAEKNLPNWECCNYRLIRDVTIAKDGKGVMQLKPIQDRRGEVLELRTSDYGRHWRVE
jgi:hypothetical protein